jgi:hypothetical protein
MPTMIYHRRPDDMVGRTLYPLNRLRAVAPAQYERQRAKYAGREALCDFRVPHLGCLWNDVLHFSPVHPAKLRELALAEEFRWREADWFEIDPAAAGFTAANSLIFLHTQLEFDDYWMPPEQFEIYRPERLAELSELPELTRNAYRAARAGTLRGLLLLSGVPHILHHGAVDTIDVPLVRI